MKFKNSQYLKVEEKLHILEFIKITCREYDVSTEDIVELEMDRGMRTVSGHIRYFIKEAVVGPFGALSRGRKINIGPNNIRDVSLQFSLHLYKRFGFETLMGTVAHELAHYIIIQKYGERGHGLIFKKVCAAIGGHMNCVSKMNWRYTCGCGS